MATRTRLCTQISKYGSPSRTRLCTQISEYGTKKLTPFLVFCNKKFLTLICLYYIITGQFAMSHGSYDLNLGSEILILCGDIRSRSWPNIGGTYGMIKVNLKPHLFAHPNPISAIISWITSWTISWHTIQNRKMVIIGQLVIQLIIALIGF
jgi:hypothetical protein